MPNEPEVLEHNADPTAVGREGLAGSLAQFFAEQFDASARRALRKVEQF